ncbi:MAG: transcription-repair coupling factor [Solirubrobacterales bacterium]
MSLRPLLEIAHADERFGALAAAARAGAQPGAPAAAALVSATVRPYAIAALLDAHDGLAGHPALIVAPDDISARDLARELAAYLAPRRVRFYPSRGTGYASHLAPPPHLVGLRIAALDALTDPDAAEPPVVVAGAVALAEAVPDASLRPAGFALATGEEVDPDVTAELFVEAGYERVDQVEDRGQFAVRGDILDVFPSTEERAARIELFGDEIESIRWFSTFTQRSLGEAERLELAPAAELSMEHRELAALALDDEDGAARPDLAELLPLDSFRAPLELLSEGTAVIISGAEEIEPALRDHWDDVTAAISGDDARSLHVDVADALRDRAALELSGVDGGQELVLRAQAPTSPARSVAEAESQLEKEVRSGYRVVVAFEHRGEAERTRYNLQRLDARLWDPLGAEGVGGAAEGQLIFAEAKIGDGFVAPDLKLAVFPFRRLVHGRRTASAPIVRGRFAAAVDLRVGDFVVHSDHGIARFAGFETKTVAAVTRDYLELEYRGEDKVFAPTDQLAKISRYVGAGGEAPALSALGSKRWDAVKSKARRAARELAGELLSLYAERKARSGHAFEADSDWELELERSFPYRETPDQLEAIEAVSADMEAPRPMDRLICGDVGYGKTEVALRAALKAVAGSKQVMMLVPTTILAQQHLGTFRERLRDFPVEVEMVSRLRKPAEAREVVKRFSEGKVDILIGTHRLLSRDVRAADLGLLIVDEEQRFGVKQKELLRQLKLKVDVLSMSATPIPRTLQMSLAGIRDISVIETPPEGRRPIRTYVGPFEDDLVTRAIKREADRDGQVFFLHNRVDTLHETAERLRAMCPGLSFGEAHGQMEEGQLETAMLDFLRGHHDCLVATTIIESGLDIPQANTLIVDRADRLGLAQAYQIRGRVGRSKERAYAYLLYPSEAGLAPDAAARLATLSDYTELGSGFAIAMRDLELRGAGDLLGDEQSGQVAAVGFELYVALLDEAVEALRASGDGEGVEAESRVRFDVPLDAYLPADYIPFEAAKIDVHRRIAGSREPGELRALRDELRDRFGPPPAPVETLIELQRTRIELGRLGAKTVEFRGGRISITPLELDAAAVGRLRERVNEAVFESRTKTLGLRVPDDPASRLAAVKALTAALSEAMTRENGELTAA